LKRTRDIAAHMIALLMQEAVALKDGESSSIVRARF
jgi:hypothetical protein